MHSSFEKRFPDQKSKENVIKRIKETKLCKSINERIALNQDLKNQLDDELINVIKANGVINIKTFNIIYLNEYVNNKFSKFIVIKLFRIPSIENIFKFELSLLDIILFSFKISWEKFILQPKMFSPISRIESEIRLFIFIICSIIKKDETDKIEKINNLNKNWKGCSVYELV